MKSTFGIRNTVILAAVILLLLLSSSHASQTNSPSNKSVLKRISEAFAVPQIRSKFEAPTPIGIEENSSRFTYSIGEARPESHEGLKSEEKQALEALAKRSGRSGAGSVEYVLGRDHSKGYLIKTDKEKISVKLQNSNRKSKAVLHEGKACYKNVLPETDAVYMPLPGGIEEMFVIWKDKGQKIINEIEITNGAIELSGEGELRLGGMELSRPVIFDSEGKKVEGKYLLKKTGRGKASVEIAFDKKGLTFPVLIDPVWRSSASMSTNRVYATATLLPNGKVLVAGGLKNNAYAEADYLNTCQLYDPSTGTWSSTGNMTRARAYHAAVLLPTGKVLVSGGFLYLSGYLASCELYDPSSGIWTATDSMSTPRAIHGLVLLNTGNVIAVGGLYTGVRYNKNSELYNPSTGTWGTVRSLGTERYYSTTTLLTNGKVLLAGGSSEAGTILNTCELYNPSTNAWSYGANMPAAKSVHFAVSLPDGRVLVGGGRSTASGVVNTCFRYNPTTNAWATTGNLGTARAFPNSVLLPDGKVLITGGTTSSGYLNSSEIYNPSSGTWASAGSMGTARTYFATTLLPSGKVLAVGGASANVGNSFTGLNSSELFDPSTGGWTVASGMSTARYYHTATLLPNGKVLVAGGIGAGSSYDLTSCELYNPSSGSWSPTGNLNTRRSNHTATLLPSGKVLVAGGAAYGISANTTSCELYDPTSGTWGMTGDLNEGRLYHTATLLQNGKVLVAGGHDYSTPRINSCELYDPSTGRWSTTGNLSVGRAVHTATLLQNGKVLVAGGIGGASGAVLSSCQLYNPTSGTWGTTGSMNTARYHHSATMLLNGKVLVTGGTNGSTSLTSCQLYDPTSGTWSTTGSTYWGRYDHTATLLPNGDVLVEGGIISWNSSSACELYNLSNATWSRSGNMNTARQYHTATLLPSGRVLVAGGSSAGALNSCELARYTEYNYTTYSDMQPSVSSIGGSSSFPKSLVPNTAYAIVGTGLKGISESSNGSYHNSATNYPRVYLQFANSGGFGSFASSDNLLDETESLYPMTSAQWASAGTSISFRTPSDLPEGYYLLSVQSNAVPSEAKMVYYSTQTDPPPQAPSDFSITPYSTTRLNYSWTDNSVNESGFRIMDGSNVVKKTAAAGATSAYETGLSVNTQYTRKVQAWNAAGAATSDSVAKYTLIQTPSGCTFETPSTTSLTVHDSGGFSRLNLGSSGVYFQNTTRGTNSGWIRTNTWASTGLSQNTPYNFRITARNGDGTITSTLAAETKYTAIAAATAATWEIATTSITIRSSSAPVNLRLGQSGIYFQNVTKGTNSGWIKTNTWVSSGLLVNTPYAFKITLRNAEGVITATLDAGTKYTAVPAPTAMTSEALTSSSVKIHSSSVPANLSSGLSGLYFKNVTKNTNSGWIKTNTWTSSSLSANTSYSFTITARNGDGVVTTVADVGSIVTALAAPSAATFDAVSTNALTIHSSAVPPNLALGSTGISFEVHTSKSGWLKRNNWTKTGLSYNTRYFSSVNFRNQTGVLASAYTGYTPYTAIQPPSSAVFSGITTGAITIRAGNTLSNLTTGSSGVYFRNSTKNTNSGWLQTNSWTSSGLSENTNYRFYITSRNSDAVLTSPTYDAGTKYSAIIRPTSATWEGFTTSSMIIHSSVAPANLNLGSSGILFSNTTRGTNSGWIRTNTWNSTGLLANTLYAYTITTRNGDGLLNSAYAVGSKYSAVEQVTSATYESVTSNSITVHAGHSVSNLHLGGSGIWFYNDTKGTNSGWIKTNTWTTGSLTPNTLHSFRVLTRNGNSLQTSFYSASKYTLAAVPAAPTVSGSYDSTDLYNCKITINPNSNPSGTYFAVSPDNGTNWLQSNGTISTTAYWSTSTTAWKYRALSANTSYSFKVKARNGENIETALSSAGSDTTPPAKPSGLASSDITAYSARLAWNSVTAANRYEVSMGTNTAGTNLGVFSTTETVMSKTGLASLKKYYWFVRAVSTANGTGEPSSIANFTTDNGIPDTPESFSIYSASASQLNYTWVDASDNESGFRILDGSDVIKRLAIAGATSTSETGLSANMQYSRKIQAYSSYGASTSAAVSKYTSIEAAASATFEPITLNGLTIHSSNQPSNLTSGSSGMYFQITSPSASVSNSGWIKTNTWAKTGLLPNTPYTYKITTRNGDGTLSATLPVSSKYTSIESVSSATFESLAAGSMTAHVGHSLTNLHLGSSGIWFYNDTRGTNSGWIKTNTWVTDSLAANTSYSFRIKTRNANAVQTNFYNASKYSAINPPGIATYEALTTSSMRVHSSSEPENLSLGSSGVYFQNVTRGTNSGWIRTNTWNSTGLNPNTRYTYRITARNGDGLVTSTTEAGSKYTLAAAPLVNTVAGSYDAIYGYHCDITLNENGNPAGRVTDYAVTPDNGSTWLQSDGSASSTVYWDKTTSWTYKNLSSNTLYSFKAKARNADGTETELSSAGSDTTPPAAPSSPTSSSITAGSARLSWSSSAGANRYEVSFGTNAAGTNLGVTSTTETVLDKTGLLPLRNYYWSVKAVSTANGTGAASSIVPFTTDDGPPSTPESFSVAPASTSQFNYSWVDASDNESGFRILDGSNAVKRLAVAGATSTSESGLSANTQYARKVQAYSAYGAATSAAVSKYTSIEAVASATYESLSSSSMTVHSASEPSNLGAGDSGLYFIAEDTIAFPTRIAISDWIKTNSFNIASLEENSPVQLSITSRNGDGTNTPTFEAVKYSLIAAASTATWEGLSTTSITVHSSNEPARLSLGDSGMYFENVTEGASSGWIRTNTWVSSGLLANTPYEFRITTRNGDAVLSATLEAGTKYTYIEAPGSATFEAALNSITVHSVNEPSNLPLGSSGMLFENLTTGNDSGWIQTNSWEDTPLSSGTSYTYRITARNGDGTETSSITASSRTLGPVVWTGGGATFNWSDADNWSSGTVPSSEDTASFDATSIKNCIIDTEVNAGALYITAGYTGAITQNAAVTIATTFEQDGTGVFQCTLPQTYSFTCESFSISTNSGTFLRFTGSGTSGSPYMIYDVYGLQAMRQYRNDADINFKLANDIEAGVTGAWNGGEGFVPVGAAHPYRFKGKFYGNSKTITGLFINRPLVYSVGLFGESYGSTIKDVGIVDCNITGAGGVGALVGPSLYSSIIENCYSTGRVTGFGNTVGGLASTNYQSIIMNSYSSCDVNNNGNLNAGGLLGYNDDSSQVINSYATGNVSGGSNVGGLIGTNNSSSITNSYAAGAVTGSSATGGLIGSDSASTISGSYYDTDTTGQSDTGKGTPETTAEMMNKYTFSGWDFDNVWGIKNGQAYPTLQWQGHIWYGGVDNNWSTAGNWNKASVPGASDMVYFNASSETDALIDSSFSGSIAGLSIGAGYGNTVTLGTSLSIANDLFLNAGVLNCSAYTITISGCLSREAGTFNAGTGTVAFDGAGRISTIEGSTTFNNFTCITPGKVLSFEAGEITTVEGTVSITGSDEALAVMRSTSDGSQWKINPSGTRSISYVDVMDSENINALVIDPPGSTDSGNNTNWFSPPPVAPSGLTVEASSQGSLDYYWANNSTDETGFRILDELDTEKALAAAGASSTSEGGLSANTQYTRKVEAYNAFGASTSDAVSRYTSIEAMSGATWETMSDSLTIHASSEPSNLALGSSGIYFVNTTEASESGWLKTNTWTSGTLSPNTAYQFTITARNAEGVETATSETLTRYTLALTPTIETVTGSYDSTSGYNCAVMAGANGNPDGTLYAVTTDEGVTYLQGDGSASGSVYWGEGLLWYYTGVQPNTLYSFKVKAANGDSLETSLSGSLGDTTPPAKPSGLTKSGEDPNQSLLTWESVASADRYELSYGTDAQGTNLGLSSTTEAGILMSGLLPDVVYFWSVSAVSTANGTGEPSSVSYFTTLPPVAPLAPSGFTATAESTTSLSYVWTANSTNEVGFRILDESDEVKALVSAGTYATSESGLAANTAYSRKVIAYNDAGESSSSLETRYTSIEASQGANWGAPDETSISISSLNTPSNLTSGSSGILFANTTLGTSSGWVAANDAWTSSGLDENVQYSFEISTRNGDGVISATMDAGARYSGISNYGATFEGVSTDQITVHMSFEPANLVSGESGLIFINETAGDDSTWIRSNGWTSTGLTPNTGYTFILKSRNGDAVENPNVTPEARYTLAASPEISTASGSWDAVYASNCTISINANGNPEATYYAVTTDDGTNWLQEDGTAAATIYWGASASGWRYRDRLPNTSYSFKVKAKNGEDIETALSASLDATTPPAKVTGLTETQVLTFEALLAWDTAAGADVYEVSIGTDGSGTDLGVFSTTEAALDKTSLQPATAYYWSVKAVSSANGTGEPSSISNFTTLLGPPSTPESFAIMATSENSLAYSWSDTSANEDGFRILDENDLVKASAGTGETSASELFLSTNEAYIRKVQAFNAIGATTSEALTGYTSIEAPSGVVWLDVGSDYISLKASNEVTNVSEGDSGILFANLTTGNTSSWLQTNVGWSSAGLLPNTQYSFSITTRNGNAVVRGTFESDPYRTLAEVPPAPQVWGGWSFAYSNYIVVTVESGSNPEGTEYAVTIDDGINWLQSDGTVSTSEYWSSARTGWAYKRAPGVTLYPVKVKSRNADGLVTALSPSSEVWTPPAKVSGLTAAGMTGTSESVTWEAADGATGYLITWGRDWLGTNEGSSVTTETSAVIAGLEPTTRYYWRIKGLAGTSEGEPSSIGTFVSLNMYAPTSCYLSNLTATSARVNWTYSKSTLSGFYIEKSLDGATYTEIGSADKSARYYTGEGTGGLLPNTRYWFRVRALDTGGFSDYTVADPKYTLANAPTFEAISDITSSVMRVIWLANSNPAGTEYFCQNITAGTNSGWITDLSWTSTGLQPLTNHTFWIKARNKDLTETSSIRLAEGATAPTASFALVKADRNTLINGDIIHSRPKLEIRAESDEDIILSTFRIDIDGTAVSDGDRGAYDYTEGSGRSVSFFYTPKTAILEGGHKMEFRVYDGKGTIFYEERDPVNVKSTPGISGPVLAYPNPADTASGPVRIAYNLHTDADMVLYLFDTSGRLIWKQEYPAGGSGGTAGYNEIVWDGRDMGGRALPNDVYLLRVVEKSTGSVLGKSKIVILRTSSVPRRGAYALMGIAVLGLLGAGGFAWTKFKR